MADNKKKRGKQDRIRVASKEAYEVNYFRRKHGITKDQAERILAEHGMRADANAAAEKLKSSK